jgi:hypothetical protein
MFRILSISSLFLLFLLGATARGQKATPSPSPTEESDTGGVVMLATTGVSVDKGVFVSKEGGFSISIPELPKQTIDKATIKAKARGADVGKQYVWLFERTLYTIYYNPPVDNDGNSYPQVFADMESGSRKGLLRANAKLITENPIKFGEYQGTEFRYVSGQGVHFVNRTFLVDDVGYQIVGGYADDKDEKTVLEVLDSFKLLKENPTKSRFSVPTDSGSETRPGEIRLNRRLGLMRNILEKGELEPRMKRFRMDIPFLRSKYSQPTPNNPSLFQYQWDFDDGIIVMSVNTLPKGTYSNLPPAARKQALSNFLQNSLTSVGGQKISEKDVSTKFAVGLEIKVKRAEDIVIARTFILGDLYVSVSAAVAGSSTEPDVMKLFDSLEFLK